MSLDPLAAALVKHEAARLRDPLAFFTCKNPRQRDLFQYVSQGIETFFRAGGSSGKTYGGAALGVALSRGVKELDGVRLPRLEQPTVGAVLSRTYKQQTESVQQAYLSLIGDWPHEIGWLNRGLGYIGLIRVKPEGGSDDPEKWSRILFVSQETEGAITGARLDWVHGDEPPIEAVWREARARAKAGHPFLSWITATPLSRSEWQWLRDDFVGCLMQPKDGRVEIVARVYDNHALTPEELQRIEDRWRNDVHFKARLNGEYVDAEGMHPWGPAGMSRLQKLQRRCARGRDLTTMIPGYELPLVCQQWFRPESAEQYILSADLSEGMDDGKHDPARFDILARKSGRHVLAWSGFADAYHVGLLAARQADHYNSAWVDFDATGGYGTGFARGLLDYTSHDHPSGYRRIVRTDHADEPGRLDSRYGYRVTGGIRAEIVSALREWLSTPEQDCDLLLRTWDSDALDSLLNVRMVRTPNGGLKVMSTGKDHDEPMFTLGRLLVLNKTLPWRPEEEARTATLRDRLKQEFGRDVLPRGDAADKKWPDNFGA